MSTHPYLLFNQQEAQSLFSRLKRGKRGQKFIEAALHHCQMFCDPDSEEYFDYKERKKDFWQSRKGQFMIPGKLLTLALTGWICNKKEYLEISANALITIIREDIIDNLGEYKTWRRNGGHDAGKLFATLGILYDLLYLELNSEEQTLLLDYCKETLEISKESYDFAIKFVDNNRGNRYFTGRSILGCAIYKDDPDYEFASICAKLGPFFLEQGLRLAFGQDGEPFEGASYGTSNLGFFYIAAHILKNIGIRDCTEDRRFQNIVDYILHETVTSGPENEDNKLQRGWINNFNDAFKVSIPDCLYISSITNQNSAGLWLWDRYAFDSSNSSSPIHQHFRIEDFKDVPWKFLWPDDEAPSPIPPKELQQQKTFHFRDRGIISSRSGWGEDDLHASIFCGVNPITAHRQADQGQVTFYGLQEQFLIDTGYLNPKFLLNTDSNNPKVNGIFPESHNLITIDNLGQSHRLDPYSGWPIGYFNHYQVSDQHFEVTCDLREAYPQNGSLKEASRYFSFYHSDAIPHAIWIDRINCDHKEHLYSLYLHTAEGNEFEIQDHKVTIHGRKNHLDLHITSHQELQYKIDTYAGHPRLKIEQTASQVEFIMVLHPWSKASERVYVNFDKKDQKITLSSKTSNLSKVHTY